jgi:hypothetical protein
MVGLVPTIYNTLILCLFSDFLPHYTFEQGDVDEDQCLCLNRKYTLRACRDLVRFAFTL